MLFVPYMGTQRGPIYYTQYEQLPTATTRVGDLKRIIVNLIPTAHRRNQYAGFVQQNGITDANISPLPALGQCQPTEEILALLSAMPEGYRPRILAGNYPILCSLSLYLLPEDETHLRSVMAQRPIITLRATVPLCDPRSPRVDLPSILQELRAQGTLRENPAGDLSGNHWELLYASVVLSQRNPALFASPETRQGWRALMKEFTLGVAAETAVLPGNKARFPLYLCTPAPLQLIFG